MRRLFLLFSAGLAVAATMPGPSAQQAHEGYRTYCRMNDKPQEVSGRFKLLCGLPNPEQIRQADGPHAFTFINVFANDAASDAIVRAAKTGAGTVIYPAGSAIIKEKLDAAGAVTGVGGMIKRKVSTPPSIDDWEFFFAEKGAKPSAENMGSCKLCHAKEAARDFVFSRWLAKPAGSRSR